MPNPKPLSDEQKQLDRDVLHILLRHVGKENPIERWELVRQVFREVVPAEQRNDDNIHDRLIRYSVSRLRNEHLICDLGDGRGRYIAKDEKEFWEFYSYYATPIQARAGTLKAMKKVAQQKFPNLMQPSLFGALEELEHV